MAMPLTLSNSDLIHATAVISTEADLAPDVQVGPFAIIEGPVTVGAGSVIEGHACLTGPMVLGSNTFVGHGAVLGNAPDRPRQNDSGCLVLGDGNVIREYVTIHRGTARRETRLGHRNYLMISAHVGQGAQIGDGCTIVNGALIGSRVELHDHCILSAHATVNPGARVGRLAMIGGLGSTTKDVPPFVLQQGYNTISGLNIVGLRRAGFSSSTVSALRDAYRIYFKEDLPARVSLSRIEAELIEVPEVAEFVAFIKRSVLGVTSARDQDRPQR